MSASLKLPGPPPSAAVSTAPSSSLAAQYEGNGVGVSFRRRLSLRLSALRQLSFFDRSIVREWVHKNKGAWTSEGCWRSLPKSAGLLCCGKSCRLRWFNYLRLELKRGNFTKEEDELIIRRKLLSRGIDPTTHRPINHDPAIINHNISFFGTASSKEKDRKNMSGGGGGGGLIVAKEEKMISSPVNIILKERCPDLNVELRISPPTLIKNRF